MARLARIFPPPHAEPHEQQAILKQRAAAARRGRCLPVRAKATDELIRAGRVSLALLARNGQTSRHRNGPSGPILHPGHRSRTRGSACRRRRPRCWSSASRPEAADALLAYLPFVDEAWVEEEIRHSLKRIWLTPTARRSSAVEQALTDSGRPSGARRRRGSSASPAIRSSAAR